MHPPKDSAVAYLLWFTCFVGLFGLHRMYAGKWFTGVLWFFTFGLLGVGQFVDLFLIPAMTGQANLRLCRQGRLVVAYA